MSLQQARWRPLMPFLYPQRIARPARSIHLHPTSRNHARMQKSMAVQRQEAAGKHPELRGDLGILEGSSLQSQSFTIRKELTSTVFRPLRKTYRTQNAFYDLGLETVEANAMALGEIEIRGCHNVCCPSNVLKE